jgi:hypothetical protein
MGKVSGKNLILRVEHPIQPPQLLTDFAPLVTVFKNLGSIGAQTAGAFGVRTVVTVAGLGVGLCFHIFKNGTVSSFGARAAEKCRRPHTGSFGLKMLGGTV